MGVHQAADVRQLLLPCRKAVPCRTPVRPVLVLCSVSMLGPFFVTAQPKGWDPSCTAAAVKGGILREKCLTEPAAGPALQTKRRCKDSCWLCLGCPRLAAAGLLLGVVLRS